MVNSFETKFKVLDPMVNPVKASGMPVFWHICAGGILGLITGLVGALLTIGFEYATNSNGDYTYMIVSGLCFGLGFGLWAKRWFELENWGLVLLIILTPGLYYCAVFTAILAYERNNDWYEYVIPGLVGGGTGAALVAALCAVLFPMMRRLGNVALIILVGGLVGGAALPLAFSVNSDLLQLAILQMIWQASVLAALSGMFARTLLR